MFSILNSERIVFISVNGYQWRSFLRIRLRDDRSFQSGEHEEDRVAHSVFNPGIWPVESCFS